MVMLVLYSIVAIFYYFIVLLFQSSMILVCFFDIQLFECSKFFFIVLSFHHSTILLSCLAHSNTLYLSIVVSAFVTFGVRPRRRNPRGLAEPGWHGTG